MKKRLLAILMVAAMTIGMLAGCGGSDASGDAAEGAAPAASEGAAASEDGAPYEITMQVVTWGQTPAEIDQVEAAINEITLPEINATVKLQPIAAWDLINETQLALTAGEKMDVVNIFVFGAGMDSISNYTSKNMIIPLNELVDQYGPAIKDNLGELLTIGYQGAELYAIPNNTAIGNDYGFTVRKDYLDEAGITVDPEKIYTAEEFEEMLLAMKEKKGDGYYGIALFGSNHMFKDFYEVDLLGGNGATGVVLDPLSGNTKVENLFESDQWMEYCKTMYKWSQEGLINPDVTTITDDITSQLQTGYYFASEGNLNPGSDIRMSNQVGTEMINVKMVEGYTSTVTASQGLYAISRTSENPEKVMQFLNMLYEDRDLSNSVSALLNAGLKDVSYEIVEEVGGSKAIVAPINDSMWSFMVPQVYGDSLNCPAYVPFTADIYEQNAANNEKIASSRVCKTFGYVFDPSEVSAEAAAVNGVVTQYVGLVGYGCVDPESTMPEFIQALKDAGIDTVIEANQKQLDAFLAAK